MFLQKNNRFAQPRQIKDDLLLHAEKRSKPNGTKYKFRKSLHSNHDISVEFCLFIDHILCVQMAFENDLMLAHPGLAIRSLPFLFIATNNDDNRHIFKIILLTARLQRLKFFETG